MNAQMWNELIDPVRRDQVQVPDGCWWRNELPREEDFADRAAAVLEDGKYRVASSDNVLDYENWGIWDIEIKDGDITVIEDYSGPRAMYRFDYKRSWKLLQAMSYECAGSHPETYTRVFRI